jgi:serine/threonine-protein kinase
MLGRVRLKNTRVFRSGGMAYLFLAELPNGKTVVYRALQDRYRLNLRIRARFRNGVRVRRKIQKHPRIVGSIKTGSKGMIPYEVIDYVNGPNLQELMNQDEDYVRKHAQRLLLQIAEAIHVVHESGFLHLDVKAANVLVDMHSDLPRSRLTDFDLAVPIRKRVMTGKELRAGTYNYMPPEQLSGGHVGRMTDVFSFGVLAYNMLSGEMPYKGGNAARSRRAKLDEQYHVVPLKQLCPHVSIPLSNVIDRCLDRDLRERYLNMLSVVKDLCRVAAVETIELVEQVKARGTVE